MGCARVWGGGGESLEERVPVGGEGESRPDLGGAALDCVLGQGGSKGRAPQWAAPRAPCPCSSAPRKSADYLSQYAASR